MIAIYNTIIDERELIGVGPLWAKRTADPVQATVYKERSFYFEIYIRGGGRAVITTDMLSFVEPYTESSDKERTAITEAHKALRLCLIDGVFTPLLILNEYKKYEP